MNYKDCRNSVISIAPEFLDALLLMFPNHSFIDYGLKQKKFISVYDVSSKIERSQISYTYDDYIVVSSKIFDFEVKEIDLIDFAVQFRQEVYKSRKRSLPLDPRSATFIAELMEYLTIGELSEDSEEIVTLFNQVGTKAFAESYLKVCENIPTAKVNKAILTFLGKVQAGAESLFYKKARIRLGPKLERNLLSALKESNRISSTEVQLQLNFIVAHQVLFEC